MERNPEEYKHSQPHYEEDEIDLIALAKTLWVGRKTIIKTTIIFACIGLFVALTTPAQYTSSIVVKPILSDSKSKLGGSLGGLAAMAGITLPGSTSSSELHPTLYPQIVESYSFQKALMQTKLNISGVAEEMTYEEYFLKHKKPSFIQTVKKYTLGLPGLIISSLKTKNTHTSITSLNLIAMSEDDFSLMKLLSGQVAIEINEKGGYVALSSTMPEALASTQMVIKAQSLLQEAIIAHKAKKAKEDLLFIEERYAEKKTEFNNAQQKLALYRDANRNVNTAIALTEVERLESEYQLAFSVYSELAKQVETQKIQVKEDTPVFAVLKEAVVPLKKSGTPKSLPLIICIFLGLVFSGGFVLLKKPVENVIKEIKRKN
jgi:LPS O-antigen subunit length determinant protein (WzzB/FepE family)